MIQRSLFAKTPSLSVPEAIKFLENSGYLVIKDDIPTISNKDLLDSFYRQLKIHLPDEALFLAQANQTSDLQAIEKFQQKAKKLGIKKSEANNMLANAIAYVFTNLEDLGLYDLPKSLSFLTTSGSWIFKKSLEIAQKKRIMYEESPEAQMYLDSLYEIEDEAYQDLKAKKTKQLLG